MAEVGPCLMDFTVTNRPPSGKVQNVCSTGFQYRGKMFSGQHEKKEEKIHQPPICETENNLTYQRKVHSAKGRLERDTKNNDTNENFTRSSNPLCYNDKSTTSVINLNSVSTVPDHDEQMFTNAVNKRAMACKHTTELLTTVAIRPSSAKGNLGSPVVKVDEENHSSISNGIKPSVYGLRLGRQVYGSEPEVLEAWRENGKEFPYRLSDQDTERQKANFTCGQSPVPSTLHPLCPWLQARVPSSVTGLDPSSCLVFLSHDYQQTDLPEVPPPQDPSDDLPYKCLVETPREPVVKKYKHPSIDRDDVDNELKRRNSGMLKPFYNGDISNLAQKPYIRNPEKIRKEIQELEDLMQGIGSLASNCSFVQFQAEITQAKELAAKLYKFKPRNDEEPRDTFGLLKIYKDHELILAALQQRRNDCIQELALLGMDT